MFPFGTDLTEEEVSLGQSLKAFKNIAAESKLKVAGQIAKLFFAPVPEKAQRYVERMQLDKPASLKEKMLQKYEPRIKLLKQEYKYPRSEVYRAYYGYQLGVAYFVTLRLEEAAMVLNEIDYRQLNPDNAFYTHLLAAQTALRLNNANMALIHCDAMLTLNRKEPVAYYTTGLALLLARKIYDGMLMLLEAYNVNDDGGLSIRFILNPGQVIRSLARVCGQVGLKDHQKVFQALADSDKCDPKYVKPIIESLKTGIVFAELDAAA